MKNIVELKGKIPVVDSRLLAKEFEQEYRVTYKLIIAHKEQLEQFGLLHFESVQVKTGRTMKIAYLLLTKVVKSAKLYLDFSFVFACRRFFPLHVFLLQAPIY